VLLEKAQRRILMVRGERVMLDHDLAIMFDVPTKALNQAVKRNLERFPDDFMFQLTKKEKAEVVTNCDHLHKLKYSPNLPYAFTEHGAIMAANVLNSKRAIMASVYIVRAFVRLREMLVAHKELARKLAEMESKYDAQFRVVFDAIRQLMEPPEQPRRRIGFHRGNKA
jgi:hypothetical protein